MTRKVKIALTMGDPAGIGPELAVRCATDPQFAESAEIELWGSESILLEALHRFAPSKTIHIHPTHPLLFSELQIGQDCALHGKAALESLDAAIQANLSHQVDALVTAPMSKAAVNLAGIEFHGHTERIAEKCGTRHFAMMQSAENIMHVVFSTTHIALREVAQQLSADRIQRVTKLLIEALKEEGIINPRIGIAALNPHAGEKGYMGIEDEQIVKPAIQHLKRENLFVDGPFPSDVLFIPQIRQQFDGLVAQYHDQGHIPFKMLAFNCGVNSTLGIPIIRTSPDHGTAYSIAWKGEADTGSLFAAVHLAIKRAQNRIKKKL